MPEGRGMGLRTGLAASYVAVAVVPLVLAVAVHHAAAAQELRQRTVEQLGEAQRAAVAVLAVQRGRVADLAVDLADEVPEDPLGVALGAPGADELAEAFLERRAARAVPDRVDAVAVVAADGEVLAVRSREPAFAAASAGTRETASDPATLAAAARGEGVVPGALVEVRELVGRGGPLGWVLALVWTDERRVADLGMPAGTALVDGGEVLAVSGAGASAVPTARPSAPGGVVDDDVDGREVLVTAAPLLAGAQGAGPEVVAWAEVRDPAPVAAAVPIAVGAALLAAVLGLLVGWAVWGGRTARAGA